MNLKNKSILVRDFGLFNYYCERLSRDFGTVYLDVPWKGSYPTPDKAYIGSGFGNVKRITQFWDYVDKVDMIAFFDVYDGDLQHYLRKKGYSVFGTDKGEVLELDRVKFRDILKELELPVAPYQVIKGLEELKNHLKTKEDKWVKISSYRGASETFHWKNWKHSHPLLDSVAKKTGEYQRIMEFMVEDPIDGVEVGSDWFVMNGMHLPMGIFGFECKDAGYVGKVSSYESLPKPIKDITDKIEPTMTDMGVSGLVSTEIRCNSKNYLTDPCMRSGSPPGELMCEMYSNFSEVVWGVAHGEEVVPKITSKYGAVVLLKSDFAKEDWCAIDFPEKNKQWVKLRNPCKIENQIYYIPQDKGYIIGASIGMGKTIEEAQAKALDVAESVEAEGIYYDPDVFDKTDEYLSEAKKVGLGKF